MSVIKPTRAYYLCDKKKECSSGWACQNGQCKHTEDVNHALNGPVVNVREWTLASLWKSTRDYYITSRRKGIEMIDSANYRKARGKYGLCSLCLVFHKMKEIKEIKEKNP